MNYSSAEINKISTQLAAKIEGFEIMVCFSQHKDELVIGLASPIEDFWMQADFNPDVSGVYFPLAFHRAKKNSVDLFPSIIKQKINKVYTHVNERSFHLELSSGQYLVFKMHGKNSNILLVDNDQVIEIFRNNLEKDFQFSLKNIESVHRSENNEALLENNLKWEEFKKTFYIQSEKQQILKTLQNKISKTEAYILKTTQKLAELQHKSDFEKIANILMANIHLGILNKPNHEFDNFYDNTTISIKLKPDLSLQKNAENYYRKAKNQKLEIQNIAQNIAEKNRFLETLKEHLEKIEAFLEAKELRNYALKHKLITSAKTQEEVFPFLRFEHENFQIWVGKNAQNNDLLTLKYAHKQDLWLHAKDVSGSHVIIKQQSGKNFPKPVIERAAQLAAFYSKRKNDTLAPVTVTSRKFVRKPKGFEPGQVIVEKEEVVLVEPKL
jgi:predicted ribosome quality control (RQC) complex YloA/Tae2 family protein